MLAGLPDILTVQLPVALGLTLGALLPDRLFSEEIATQDTSALTPGIRVFILHLWPTLSKRQHWLHHSLVQHFPVCLVNEWVGKNLQKSQAKKQSENVNNARKLAGDKMKTVSLTEGGIIFYCHIFDSVCSLCERPTSLKRSGAGNSN